MKKVMKKRLKEDEFVSTMHKIFRFFQRRTRELAAAGILILLAALVFAGYRVVRAQVHKKESRLIGRILELRQDLDEKPENLVQLEEMAGRGKYARLAHVLLAAYWMEKGELERAGSSLEKIPGRKKDFIYYQAQDLLAQVHVRQGKLDGAVEIYERLEREKPRAYALDVILFRKAEALEKMGEKKRALELYERLQDEFNQTFYGYEASQKARKLEAGK